MVQLDESLDKDPLENFNERDDEIVGLQRERAEDISNGAIKS